MPIPEGDLDQLEDALIEITGSAGDGMSWREKKDDIMSRLSDAGKAALEEFIGWFDEEDF